MTASLKVATGTTGRPMRLVEIEAFCKQAREHGFEDDAVPNDDLKRLEVRRIL